MPNNDVSVAEPLESKNSTICLILVAWTMLGNSSPESPVDLGCDVDEMEPGLGVTTAGHQAEHALIANVGLAPFEMEENEDVLDMDLSKYAAPTQKRRGRPKKCFAGLDRSEDVVAVPSIAASSGGNARGDGHSGMHGSRVLATLGGQSRGPILADVASNRLHGLMVPTSESENLSLISCMMAPNKAIGVMFACAEESKEVGAGIDEDYFKLDASYLSDGTDHHVATIQAAAQKLDMSRFTLQNKLCRLACSQWLASRFQKSCLEEQIVSSLTSASLIAFVECVMFDETPLKIASRKADVSDAGLGLSADNSVTTSDSQALKRMATTITNDSVSGKVLQVRPSFGMLLYVNGQYVTLYGDNLAPLQLLATGHSAILQEALKRTCVTSSWANKFQLKCRVACMDRGSANAPAEKSLCQGRSEAWQNFICSCSAHATCNAMSHTVGSLMSTTITGLLATALSLRHGGALQAFRKCLTAEIQATLEIKRGSPGREAQEHKGKMMQLFMSSAATSLMDKALLHKLPNGDWRNPTAVEFYVSAETTTLPDKHSVAIMLSTTLVSVMLSSKPKLFTQNRWTGIDVAIDELGRLECCHKLLSRSYKRFLKVHSSGSKSLVESHSSTGLTIDNTEPALVDPDDVALVASASSGVQCVLPENLVPHDVGPSTEAAQSNEQKRSSEEHSKDRAKAQHWMKGDILDELVLLRLGVESIVDLMSCLLEISGEAWEQEQRAKVLEKQSTGEDGKFLSRDYMLTLASDLRLEGRFLKHLTAAFKTNLWELVSEDAVNTAFNHLAFRVLSRQGCLVEETMVQPHSCYPYAMFGLLTGSKTAGQVLAVPKCVLDPWSTEVCAMFPTLTEMGLYHVLELHCTLASTTIASVESRHSSIRRQLVQRSVQTHVLPLHCLSADWLFQNIRAAKRLLKQSTPNRSYVPSKDGKMGERKVKQRGKGKGKAGLWRAFIRWKTVGQVGTPNLQKLGVEYREAVRCNSPILVYLQKLSFAALKSGGAKLGQSSFGHRGQYNKRRCFAMQRKAIWIRTMGMSPLQKAEQVANATLHMGGLQTCISSAKTLQYLHGVERNKRLAATQERLQAFAQGPGLENLTRFKSCLPSLPLHAKDVLPIPASKGQQFYLPALPAEWAMRAIALANNSKRSNLGIYLEQHWLALHEPISAESCNELLPAKPASKCADAGMCLCTGLGKQLLHMKNRLLKHMKEVFVSRVLKQKAASGMIILCFSRHHACPEHVAAEANVYCHLGAMSWSPYKPTFVMLKHLLDHPLVGRNTSRLVFEVPPLYVQLPTPKHYQSMV
eukprot:3537993-Amphidinium_carterae.1